MTLFDIFYSKEEHLRKYLEERYDVKIIKKYKAYTIVKNGELVEFFYDIEDVEEFLDGEPNYREVMIKNGFRPEKRHCNKCDCIDCVAEGCTCECCADLHPEGCECEHCKHPEDCECEKCVHPEGCECEKCVARREELETKE